MTHLKTHRCPYCRRSVKDGQEHRSIGLPGRYHKLCLDQALMMTGKKLTYKGIPTNPKPMSGGTP